MRDGLSKGDAGRATDQVLFRSAAIARGVLGIAGAFAGVFDAGSSPWTGVALVAVAVNLIWSLFFVWRAVGRGLTPAVMAVDLAEVAALCLLQRWVVSPEGLPTGASWISALVGARVIYGHIGVRPAMGFVGGMVVVAAYVTGQVLASVPGSGIANAGVYLLQNLCGLVLLALLRKVGRAADAELDEFHRSRGRAHADRIRRAGEREADRRLHDTVLATLTMVGSGAITESTARLRFQARSDLRVVSDLRGDGAATGESVRLDKMLREVPGRVGWSSGVRLDVVCCVVPPDVAEAFVGAAHAALANAHRYAGIDHATLTLTQDVGGISVVVSDSGRGFDPAAVPAHKYGLREAVVGRLAAVGGHASVDSVPGQGTAVTLRWSGRD
ncbi:hypothetical protein BS329_17940 [Amycolatopsis coloradensis]|uniref:Histidine kinase/HSP90-like ATPase domain-containing protein n=1 Tax=Amycolatopsis coloradensis TaxID=76021 RepID=A0A1R0KT35_9PSEU|nr:ATP-binding protein [Amycolatopsis coloradensis]OLZ51122.1 hypothetical protein BS329_17940 [Amycolatopsis coloradensis]